jgi:hypothetical protein
MCFSLEKHLYLLPNDNPGRVNPEMPGQPGHLFNSDQLGSTTPGILVKVSGSGMLFIFKVDTGETLVKLLGRTGV